MGDLAARPGPAYSVTVTLLVQVCRSNLETVAGRRPPTAFEPYRPYRPTALPHSEAPATT
jgi:hypothetical protein